MCQWLTRGKSAQFCSCRLVTVHPVEQKIGLKLEIVASLTDPSLARAGLERIDKCLDLDQKLAALERSHFAFRRCKQRRDLKMHLVEQFVHRGRDPLQRGCSDINGAQELP
jgi:hypothetical protein